MFEKFSPEGNNDNDNDIQSKIEINSAQLEYAQKRLLERENDDPEQSTLNDEQREALRKVLLESGQKIRMYKQFQSSINSKTQEAKVIEMNPENEDEDSNRFRKAI
ncbi:MAG: hypothetical protein KBC42_00290 [Candidatus Pacebacteria bacterium]|nr:hypothetical protein [Candidatus Paceibacterota bacterium]MBP9780346.1 hypothetical protein [Candidatus Paceibacterota bacterium]